MIPHLFPFISSWSIPYLGIHLGTPVMNRYNKIMILQFASKHSMLCVLAPTISVRNAPSFKGELQLQKNSSDPILIPSISSGE